MVTQQLEMAVAMKYDLYDQIISGDSIQIKRLMITSIFPENLCFDERVSGTGRINEIVQEIDTLNKRCGKTKSRKTSKTLTAPDHVTLIGLMSNHFLNDLELLASLSV